MLTILRTYLARIFGFALALGMAWYFNWTVHDLVWGLWVYTFPVFIASFALIFITMLDGGKDEHAGQILAFIMLAPLCVLTYMLYQEIPLDGFYCNEDFEICALWFLFYILAMFWPMAVSGSIEMYSIKKQMRIATDSLIGLMLLHFLRIGGLAYVVHKFFDAAIHDARGNFTTVALLSLVYFMPLEYVFLGTNIKKNKGKKSKKKA